MKRVIAILSIMVLLITANSTKLMADTLERLPACGLEEHVHAEACFDEAGDLACELVEHTHTDACYQQRPTGSDVEEVDAPEDEDAEMDLFDSEDEVETERYEDEAGASDEEWFEADEPDEAELSLTEGEPDEAEDDDPAEADEEATEEGDETPASDEEEEASYDNGEADEADSVDEDEADETGDVLDDESGDETGEEETPAQDDETAEIENAAGRGDEQAVEPEDVAKADEEAADGDVTEDVEKTDEETTDGEKSEDAEKTDEESVDGDVTEDIEKTDEESVDGDVTEDIEKTDEESVDGEVTEDAKKADEENKDGDVTEDVKKVNEEKEDSEKSEDVKKTDDETADSVKAENIETPEEIVKTDGEVVLGEITEDVRKANDEAVIGDVAGSVEKADAIPEALPAENSQADSVVAAPGANGYFAATIDLSNIETYPISLNALMEQATPAGAPAAEIAQDAAEDVREAAEPVAEEIDAVRDDAATIEDEAISIEDEAVEPIVEAELPAEEADASDDEPDEETDTAAAPVDAEQQEITLGLDDDDPEWSLHYDGALLSIEPGEEGYALTILDRFDETVVTVNNGDIYTLTLLNGAVPVEYPPVSFSASTDYVMVSVTADEGAFPAGTTMTVRDVDDEATIEGIAETVSEDFVEVERVHAVDISFHDANGAEIEPRIPISVAMTAIERIEEDRETVVVHVDDVGEPQVVDTVEPDSDAELSIEEPVEAAEPELDAAEAESIEAEPSVVFTADAFSVYALVVAKRIETKVLASDGETYKIEVSYGAEAGIPDGATLDVREVTEDEAYRAEVEAQLAGNRTVTLARFFDIKIMNGDEEVHPLEDVEVRVTLSGEDENEDEAEAGQAAVPCAVHFTEDGINVIEATETEAAVSFQADGFSVWGVVYTVDFHYEMDGREFSFTMPGGGVARLSDIFDALHIGEDAEASVEASDEGYAGLELDDTVDPAQETETPERESLVDRVADVEFSNAELMWVGKPETPTTVDAIKAEYGLVSEYSADLGEEIVEEYEAQTVEAGEWILVSLRPFDSVETLTVTMDNGDAFTITVTDAQKTITDFVNDLNGKKYALITLNNVLLTPEWQESGRIKARQVDVNAMDENTPQWLFTYAGYDSTGYKFYISCDGQNLRMNDGNVWTSNSRRQALYVDLYANNQIRIIDGMGNAVNLMGQRVSGGFSAYKSYNNVGWNELFKLYDLSSQPIDPNGRFAIYTEAYGRYYVLKNDLTTVAIDATEDALKELPLDYLWQFETSDLPNNSYIVRTVKDGKLYQLQFYNGWRLVAEEDHTNSDDTVRVWMDQSGKTKIWSWDDRNQLYFNVWSGFEANDQGLMTEVRLYNVDRRFFTVESADPDMGRVTGWDMYSDSRMGEASFVTRTNIGNQGVYTNNWSIQAVPQNGYTFDHWELDGVPLDVARYPQTINGSSLPITKDGGTLRAVFKEAAPQSTNPYEARPVPGEPYWIFDALTADPISGTDKTAEVYDYENRIYRVDLTGHSGFKAISSDLALAFVTDVSNSMLFPDSLKDVKVNGKNITLQYKSWSNTSLGAQIRNKGLDPNKVYITIGDLNTTSTQYAVFHANANETIKDHTFTADGWYALDASYYARWQAGVYGWTNAKMYSSGVHRCYALDSTYSLHSSDSNDNKYPGGYTYTIYEPNENWKTSFKGEKELYAQTDDKNPTYANRLFYLSESVKQALEQMEKMANYYPLGAVYAALETFAGTTEGTAQELLDRTLGESKTWSTRHQRFVQIGGATAYNNVNFADNQEKILKKLKNLTTYDGTAQDIAIQRMTDVIPWTDIPSSSNLKKYVIMITDGAPNRKDLSIADVTNAINGEKNGGTLQDTTLITVGLGIDDVPGGQQLLHNVADTPAGESMPLYYSAKDGKDLMNILMEIVRQIMEEAAVVGDVEDTIDPVFYPVNKDTGKPITLRNGKGYINLRGEELNGKPNDKTPYGEVTYDQASDTWKVTWYDQDFKPEKNGGWHGTVYVKSKEDFMGGNTINTNQGQATITPKAYYSIDENGNRAAGAKDVAIPDPTETYPNDRKKPVPLDTPHVNVDELSLSENKTEWTVYLDTTVSPREQIKALYEKIRVNEVVDHTRDGAHKVNDGNTTYPLREGTADNTTPVNGQEQFLLTDLPNMGADKIDWDTLFTAGKIENIPYSAYGHDAGSFTIELVPIYAEHENRLADETGNGHAANIVGDEVEKYTLKVTYIPKDYDPNKNYHTGSYGTKKAGKLTDETASTNRHIINVYAKPIDVRKVDRDDPTIPVAGAKFGLYRPARADEIANNRAVELAEYNPKLTDKYYCVDEETSDANGLVQLTNPLTGMDDRQLLVPGVEYILIETEAPEGYLRDDTVRKITVLAGPNRYTDLEMQQIAEANIAENRPYDWEQGVRIYVDGKLARIVDPTTRTDEAGREFIYKNDIVVFQTDYTNQRVRKISLKKVGISNSDPEKTQSNLGGAKFTMYYATGASSDTKGDKVVLNGVTLENLVSASDTGIIWQGELPVGRYLLEEVETPSGYNTLSGLILMDVTRNGVTASCTVAVGDMENVVSVTQASENEFSVAIVNTAGVSLPATGGSGTAIYTAAGIGLIALALFLLMKRRQTDY